MFGLALDLFSDLCYTDSLGMSSCYINIGNFNYYDASTECMNLGGKIPWVMTKDEVEVLMNHYAEEMWIGLADDYP